MSTSLPKTYFKNELKYISVRLYVLSVIHYDITTSCCKITFFLEGTEISRESVGLRFSFPLDLDWVPIYVDNRTNREGKKILFFQYRHSRFYSSGPPDTSIEDEILVLSLISVFY